MKKPKHDWATALQQELRKQCDGVFTKDHKTIQEIRDELRKTGKPSGISYVATLVRKLVREGKATRTDGLTLSPDGRQIRCIKYLLHP